MDRNRTAVNGVPLTDNEFYTYAKTRGAALGSLLSRPNIKMTFDQLAATSDRLNQQAGSAPNPVTKAKLEAAAAKLKSGVMEKFEAIADKQAAAAVERVRGY